MKLYTSPTSPYARKVRVVLTEKKIECEFVDADPWIAETTIPQFNPLGKIPVLILDDGTELYDSRVIVEYLDTVSPVSRLIPEPSRQRIAVRRWEAPISQRAAPSVTSICATPRSTGALRSRTWSDSRTSCEAAVIRGNGPAVAVATKAPA